MAAQVVRGLGIPETADNLVKWDPKQRKHSPGTRVLALIVNILMGRIALHRFEEFYENLDVPVLFGLRPRLQISTTRRLPGHWTRYSRQIPRRFSAMTRSDSRGTEYCVSTSSKRRLNCTSKPQKSRSLWEPCT